MFSTLLTLVPVALAAVSVSADASSRARAVHNGVAKRASGELAKRFSDTRWTFYDVGLGACGQTNVASDFIVALNAEQFGSGYPGPNCFKQIQMNYNGKSAVATIMDMCPGCPYGGLDLSRGLFDHFDSEDKGVLSGDWSFVGDSAAYVAPAASTSTKAAVTSTTNAAVKTSAVVNAASHTTSASVHSSSSTASATGTHRSSTHRSSTHRSSTRSSSVAPATTFTALVNAASTNATAQIKENVEDIKDLVGKLSTLIVSALDEN